MYAMVKVEDTIRILPEKFGEDLDEVVREIVQKSFEGTMRKVLFCTSNLNKDSIQCLESATFKYNKRKDTEQIREPFFSVQYDQ